MPYKTKHYSFLMSVVFFFMNLLPKRSKRLILLTTLYVQLVEKGVFHEETLDKLNRVLCLANDSEALTLPCCISCRVWDSKELEEITASLHVGSEGISCLAYKEARRVSDEILSLSPYCLRYGDRDTMTRDVVNLFYCQPVAA